MKESDSIIIFRHIYIYTKREIHRDQQTNRETDRQTERRRRRKPFDVTEY